MRMLIVSLLALLALMGCPRYPYAGTSCTSTRIGDTVYTNCY